MQNFQRNEVVLLESAANPSEAHVLVTGIARITCLDGRNERVTVALIAPGPIPAFPCSTGQSVRLSLRSL